MSYDLANDADGVPGPSFPGISAANLRRVSRASLALLGLIFLALVLGWAVGVYTDWLWFGQLGLRGVFAKILLLRAWLFVAGTGVAAAVLSLNLWLTWRFSRGSILLNLPPDSIRLLTAFIVAAAALTMLIASPVFGTIAAGRWETILLVFNRVPFGVADPQFGLDATFYIVTLHLLDLIQGWLLGLIITVIAASLAFYFAIFSLRGVNFFLTPRMLKHLAVLGIGLMLIIAASHALAVFELVLGDRGLVAGATYADVNARMPVFWFLSGISVLAAAGFGVSIYYGGLRFMVGSFSLWLILLLLVGIAFPALFQRFKVAPNEYAREEPYILRNLEATRAAYQLDQTKEPDYAASGVLDQAAIRENGPTINNIRLWDRQPLRDAYNQLQFMELYYSFPNMDYDRYMVDGRLRQVLVAARELDSDNLPADAGNWVNQRLQYTHGYGVAMSPATDFTPGEGRPTYYIQDIPIQGKLRVSRPEVYYGESDTGYVVVRSSLTEVSPASNLQRYAGNGGVGLGSSFRRAAYAWKFGDVNLLLSDQITGESRIQYRRQVSRRVTAVAPFLDLDQDPYPVLDDDGKLWWIQDAYTTTLRYPYSTPIDGEFNYIRNSVKVTVDAYNGTIRFYVIDPADPLLRMYWRAFPDLFKDMAEMPAALRDHIRYPTDLFTAQAQIYLRYHVTEPQVFFNQAEQWAIPQETRFGKTGVRLTPSYMVMRLPGEEKEEFVLLLPLTPAGEKRNLVGWLAARSDGLNYGELLAYQLPSDRQIDGPSQVEARIENDQQVSQQFTLWDGSGSQVIRGQLLVIPIAGTILYVEPLYLQSAVLAFPELKKVILADGSNVVMADTLDEGLALLVGGVRPSSASAGLGAAEQPSPAQDELEQIEESISQLEQALESLRESLENLRQSLGGGRP